MKQPSPIQELTEHPICSAGTGSRLRAAAELFSHIPGHSRLLRESQSTWHGIGSSEALSRCY